MQHQKPLFVFDWDEVISHTDRLRDLTQELFSLIDLPSEGVAEVANRVVETGGYNFNRHAHELAKLYPEKEISLFKLQQSYDLARDHLGSVIYPDAERFLRRLYGRYPMAVLTVGDPEFQQQKVYRSGLTSLFSQMIFLPTYTRGEGDAPKSKSRALGQLLELYPSILYFEDRADTIGRIYDEHKHHNRIIPLRVSRANKPGRYSHVITSFDHPLPPIVERLLTDP